jgi:hypothetical protein
MAQAARAFKQDITPRPAEKPRRSKAHGRTRATYRAMPAAVRRTIMIGVPLALLIAYVGLTAQLTAQTYRLADDKKVETQLVQTNNALRARVGQLESLSRLEAAAVKLHMTYPKRVSQLMLPGGPKPQPENTALAFVARLLHVR